MTTSTDSPAADARPTPTDFMTPGVLALVLACVGAGWFFWDGLDALLTAWQLPEYSHGPMIPLLSALMFLRELKAFPPRPGPIDDRWPGVALIVLALCFGALGKLARIDDMVAYATIIWVAGILLVSFGWSTGRHFWPPVLHLVYMLPLPATLYYKTSTNLQMISSEIGVWLLKLFSVPVYLEGNIIDLGVMRLHVAEACSGLRYLFPILSFSYIFAVLYRGPVWHKVVLLLSAVPITVLMNSVRIAVAGIIANHDGIEYLQGFTHFFEGWVVFIACIILMFGLARLMLFFHRGRPTLADALDLDTSHVMSQLSRLRFTRASAAMLTAVVLGFGAVAAWQMVPETRGQVPDRHSFATFPRDVGDWHQQGLDDRLDPDIVRALEADDYRQSTLARGDDEQTVGLFMAWYRDQTKGGVHSPEICLPASGWEIARIERTDLGPSLGIDRDFLMNRAVIQKGETRMLVYYWFQQGERQVAWDFAAKMYLLADGIRTGQTNGGIVRLTTLIRQGETEAAADARLLDVTRGLYPMLSDYFPY